MNTRRVESDVDVYLSLSSLDSRLVRRLIALVTVATGASGLVLIPSGALRPEWSAIPVVFSVGCLAIAFVWLRRTYPPHWKTLFVVFSDVGIVTILFAFEDYFVAMPGVALLFIVALFAAVYTSPLLLLVHTGYAAAVTVLFFVLSVQEGYEPTLVVSRALTILSGAVAPLAMRLYISALRREVRRSHADPLTGLLTQRGLEHGLASVGRLGITIGIELVHVHDPRISPKPLAGSSIGEAVTELATGLERAAPPGVLLARTGSTELVCVTWGSRVRVLDTLGVLSAEINDTSLRSARVTVLSKSEIGILDENLDASVVVQRLAARARLDLQASQLRDRAVSSSEPMPGNRIRSIVESGGPRIVYQPIFSTRDDSIVGYEALSRFPAGFGSTHAWFAAAAETGQSAELELAAIERALAGHSSLPPGAFLCVNASAATILTTDLPEMLTGISSIRRVVVELTEHDMVDDYAALVHAVSILRSSGVDISVDDVGSGYSGLRHVVEVRPDIIKLDASIVRGIDDDPVRRAAAKAIVILASEIRADTIFEGVETAAELDAVKLLGATMVQGFLMGRPRSFTPTEV